MSNEMNKLRVPTVAEMIANNERPDILFWVGCSGSFDDRACLLYTSPSPRDRTRSRMPSSA